MSHSIERKTIETILESFGAANPTIPISYEGRNFERPASTVSWLALFILGNTGSKIELGPNVSSTFRRGGIIQINIHTPSQKGSEAAREIADILDTYFNNQDFPVTGGIIRTGTSSLKSIGTRDGFYSMIYDVPFSRDSQGA